MLPVRDLEKLSRMLPRFAVSTRRLSDEEELKVAELRGAQLHHFRGKTNMRQSPSGLSVSFDVRAYIEQPTLLACHAIESNGSLLQQTLRSFHASDLPDAIFPACGTTGDAMHFKALVGIAT
jgi:hypothetical protein